MSLIGFLRNGMKRMKWISFNKNNEVVLREPEEILEEMNKLDEDSKKIIKNLEF